MNFKKERKSEYFFMFKKRCSKMLKGDELMTKNKSFENNFIKIRNSLSFFCSKKMHFYSVKFSNWREAGKHIFIAHTLYTHTLYVLSIFLQHLLLRKRFNLDKR